jgi:hypothetical protein
MSSETCAAGRRPVQGFENERAEFEGRGDRLGGWICGGG